MDLLWISWIRNIVNEKLSKDANMQNNVKNKDASFFGDVDGSMTALNCNTVG